MSAEPSPNIVYFVTDEMLQRFAKSSTLQRLQWLDEMRTFSWHAATDVTRARWRTERDHARGGVEITRAPRAAR